MIMGTFFALEAHRFIFSIIIEDSDFHRKSESFDFLVPLKFLLLYSLGYQTMSLSRSSAFYTISKVGATLESSCGLRSNH